MHSKLMVSQILETKFKKINLSSPNVNSLDREVCG